MLRGRDTAEKIAANSRWEYEGRPYWGGEVDCCINGFTLANGVWLGADVTDLLGVTLGLRMADGGWNCEWVEGSTRSSFHSTLNTVRGLLAYEAALGSTDEARAAEVRAARHSGEEYLLQRGLFRRLSTGEPVGPWALHLSYPFRWVYDVLRATDHLREASLHDGTPPDPRAAEAIERIRAARQPDGTWLQGGRLPGWMWFEVDVPAGEPSKWLTLYATRVLTWWDGARS